MLDDLYQELILDHHRNPRCHGTIDAPDVAASLFNPLCGDEVVLHLRLNDGVVEDIRFSGHGCSISQASASMMGELCKGKTLAEVQALCSLFLQMMLGKRQGSELDELGDAVALEGVQKFPARIRCAMLAWEALEQGLKKE